MASPKPKPPAVLEETEEVKQLLDKAIAAHANGHYALSIPEFKLRANEGYPRAKLWLGIAYRDGHGIEQDGEQALAWLTLAANAGLAEADYLIAEMYNSHICIEADYDKRNAYYQKAAKAGHVKAMFVLADIIYKQQRKPEDACHAIALLCSISNAKEATYNDQRYAWQEIIRLSTDTLNRHFAK